MTTVRPALPYWADTTPGAGRRTPRADATSSARRMSLNGQWAFRLSPTAAGTGTDFLSDDADVTDWDDIRVPSHWVLEEVTPLAGGPARSLRGTAEGPLYTNTAFPIPLDAPHIPHENPTGDYRVEFDAPTDWAATVLRFQGVDSCAKVWLNGEELGFSTGSRLAFEFDVTLRPGRNVLCVRVHRWSSGTYLEDQDMWWLPGIFRDVELLERPEGGFDDHFVHADYDATTGTGTLRVDTDTPGRVEIPELGITLAAGETITVPVDPWSAETPRLYRGTLSNDSETVDLSVGFRRVEIVDGVLQVNGSRIFFRGVNRHEHDPETGRTLDRETMIRDILLMKQNNVNAVRTSHYPPHPEFLRLCDEYGLWVVVEADLETHGFIYAGWEGNPPAVDAWHEAMHDRLERTVERDKNRPSVIIWSMANESDAGHNFTLLEQWLRDRDPSRAILYERDRSYRSSDFDSQMYPSLDLLEQIGLREDPRPDGVSDADDQRRRSLPFLLVEYAHAMGNGPGSLSDYHRILRSHERFCGGFVWEWIDHGYWHETADGEHFIMHGGDVAYRPNGGRYCLDGMVFADRTPSPALAEFKAAVQPVNITINNDGIVLRNEYDHVSTAHLTYTWTLSDDGIPIGHGSITVPALAVGEQHRMPLPAAALAGIQKAKGETWLTVDAALAADTIWADAGHSIAIAQGQVGTPSPQQSAPDAASGTDMWNVLVSRGLYEDGTFATGEITVGEARFDLASGYLTSFRGVTLEGPVLDVYRAPTENDRGQGGLNDLASVWAAVGLDRMLDRCDQIARDGDRLRVRGRLAPSTHAHGLVYEFVYTPVADGLRLDVDVDFVGPWTNTPFRQRDIIVPRLGLRFALPQEIDHAEWFGRGPNENYVDSRDAALIGRYTATIEGLQVDYPTPQENGTRTGTRWVELRDGDTRMLRVEAADEFAFSARRWTANDLTTARHPHDLVARDRVWLSVDHAHMGIGSASVGPALPEKYRVARERTQWTITLR